MQYFSKGERFTLIKSILSSLPTEHVSFCHAQEGEQEDQEDAKKFFAGWGFIREKATFCEMGDYLQGESWWRPWNYNPPNSE